MGIQKPARIAAAPLAMVPLRAFAPSAVLAATAQTSAAMPAMADRADRAPQGLDGQGWDRHGWEHFVMDRLAEEASRPRAGISGLDDRLSPLFPGMAGLE